jgi:EAL domain-containing protein (putative c-di-GMP-specific phosphodiesterase class I)
MAGKELTVTASIGIVTAWGDETTAGELIRDADIAMYKAKRDGGGRYAFYTPDLYAHALERLELLTDLQVALARNEFEVQYQPTIILQTGDISGFEALVRWRHPRRGLLLPDKFIHLAEESNLIHGMGRWVLLQACLTAKRLQEEFPSDVPLTMNVNVSVRQLQEADFARDVGSALKATKLAPACLTLEVTESVMMENVHLMTERFRELKQLGIRLAIDDFGTGYSSLSYLRQFPFDILKVDKAFVDNNEDEDGRDLARGIIELGRTLQLEIIAEGIEREDQVATLKRLDCEMGQGFYFSRPIGGDQLADLINRTRDRSVAA